MFDRVLNTLQIFIQLSQRTFKVKPYRKRTQTIFENNVKFWSFYFPNLIEASAKHLIISTNKVFYGLFWTKKNRNQNNKFFVTPIMNFKGQQSCSYNMECNSNGNQDVSKKQTLGKDERRKHLIFCKEFF